MFLFIQRANALEGAIIMLIRIICAIAIVLALLDSCDQQTPTPSPDMHDYCDGSLFEPLTCDNK